MGRSPSCPASSLAIIMYVVADVRLGAKIGKGL